jgi:hypothetical protein
MRPLPLTLAMDPVRGWRSLLLVGACGLAQGLTVWWAAPDAAVSASVEEAVGQLEARLQSAPVPSALAASSGLPASVMVDAPSPDDTMALWPWLQQRLQAHGLQVQALQPQPLTVLQGLPEQMLRLRLQGRWHDWQAFVHAMHAHVPWWVIEQWQVLPAGAGQPAVRIELQARLALRPQGLAPEHGGGQHWPVWPVAPATPGPDLFGEAMPQARIPEAQASEAWAQDPRQWPVHRLRLLGIWREGHQVHAVLGQGPYATVVRPGQRIGREGYRVGPVNEQGLWLYPPGPGEPPLRLDGQGDKP